MPLGSRYFYTDHTYWQSRRSYLPLALRSATRLRPKKKIVFTSQCTHPTRINNRTTQPYADTGTRIPHKINGNTYGQMLSHSYAYLSRFEMVHIHYGRQVGVVRRPSGSETRMHDLECQSVELRVSTFVGSGQRLFPGSAPSNLALFYTRLQIKTCTSSPGELRPPMSCWRVLAA